VGEYTGEFYLPAARQFAHLAGNNMEKARDLSAWKERIQAHWSEIRVDAAGDIAAGDHEEKAMAQQLGDGLYLYALDTMACPASGLHGFALRVLPRHAHLAASFLPGLITWAGDDASRWDLNPRPAVY